MSQADFLAADSRMNKRIKVEEVSEFEYYNLRTTGIKMFRRIEAMDMRLAITGTRTQDMLVVVGKCYMIACQN